MESLETEVKKYITSLLTSTPLAITMKQLNKDYINTIGMPIPYQKLGYNSLEHFLRSISDTVQVRGSGPLAEVVPVVSAKSAHINQLVTKQVVKKNKKSFCNSQRRARAIFPAGYNMSNAGNKYPATPNNTCPNKNDTTKTYSFKNYSERPTYTFNPPSDSKTYQSKEKVEVVPEKQINLFKDVKKPEEIYKPEKEVQLQEKPTNNSSVLAHNKVINNPKRNITTQDISSGDTMENSVPFQIRKNLKTLIRQCPEGIWCAEIPDKYRKMFRHDLDYQELGFKSLIHLCVYLPSIFHFARPSTGDYRLYDKTRPLPDCAEKTYTIASYSKAPSELDSNNALPSIDWADVKKFLPPDIFMLGEEIPRTFVSRNTKENDNIDIVIGEIYDLSKFWVYLDDNKLETLMDEMQEFYKEHEQEYLIPDHLIKEGIYCVQVIFGEYHRALIVDTMPKLEDSIRVIFIDYGTMIKVSTKGLCFLHMDFSVLPWQAIRCRLTNLFPVDEGAPWSREACKAFRRLTVDKNISAKISHINWEDQYLEVYLADVTDESNIFYINDKLVEQGFARLADKVNTVPVSTSVSANSKKQLLKKFITDHRSAQT